MMGGKYWFVVNSKDSAKLKAILDAKLSKRFQMVRQNPKQVYEALPVELKSPEAQTFRSNFCLRYDTQKVAEIAKLKQLAFKPAEIDGKNCLHTLYFCRRSLLRNRRKMLPKTAVLTLPFRSEFIMWKPKQAPMFGS